MLPLTPPYTDWRVHARNYQVLWLGKLLVSFYYSLLQVIQYFAIMILSFRYRLPHFVNSTEALSETMTDSTIDQPVLHNGSQGYRVPLLINDAPILREDDTSRHHSFEGGYFQGADLSDCTDAVSSCSKAFVTWSTTSPTHRRGLLLRLAQVLCYFDHFECHG